MKFLKIVFLTAVLGKKVNFKILYNKNLIFVVFLFGLTQANHHHKHRHSINGTDDVEDDLEVIL